MKSVLLFVKVLILFFITLESHSVEAVNMKTFPAFYGDIVFPTDDTDETLDQGLKDRLIFKGSTESEEKCLEYTGNTISNKNLYVIHVVGGTRVFKEEFPFMAAVGFPNSEDQPEWRCGATLISDRWVLTAAHCTYSVDSPKWIRLGSLDMSKNKESSRRDYLIEQVVVHPGYKYPEKYNDIALLRTNGQIQFSKAIRPACLYTKSDITESLASATGWGQTAFAGPNSDKLLKVDLQIHNNSVCSKAYEKDIKTNKQLWKGVVNSMVCAGELRGGRDTCLGDSGGPLFIRDYLNKRKFYVLGVTSFGKLCGQENIPAIYTRVSKYVQWIENIVWT